MGYTGNQETGETESDSLKGTGKEIQTGGLPMKIETRYLSGGQADTKTTLFGRNMELPVCFYTDEGIVVIPPYEDVEKIEAALEKAAKAHALAAGIALDMLFDEKGKYLEIPGGMTGPKTMEDLQDLQSFAKKAGIPLLVKGILSQRDAYQCLKAGVSGIILSRPVWLKEKSISPIEALPEILKVTAGEIPVLVELENADMADTFTAMALGADAVCRKLLQGEEREEILCSMQDELRCLMSAAGCRDLSHMDSTVIWKNLKEDH